MKADKPLYPQPSPCSGETIITVVVACKNDQGSPDLFTVQFPCTNKDYSLGFWESHAIEAAEAKGFREPFICYGPEDLQAIHSVSNQLSDVGRLPIISVATYQD